MKEIRVTKELGECVVCRKRLKPGELYYDVDGMWVHKKCWENYRIK